MTSQEYVLKAENISKSFVGVQVLKKVSLKVRKGTVHALMGENGAGKSTLMKTLIGLYQPDEGSIEFNGKVHHIANTQYALNLGISMIHQELMPILEMTVADNIFMGRYNIGKRKWLVEKNLVQKKVEELFHDLGISGITANAKMNELSLAQIQMVEIVKAVSYNADLIIMDEPTSTLMDNEVEILFKIIRTLTARNIGIIYISHKMDEIFVIADEITVLRDGENAGHGLISEITRDDLISMMVGRQLTDLYHKEKLEKGDVILEVQNLASHDAFTDVSFQLHKGEVLGFAGLMGAGRTEIVETIFGLREKTHGKVLKNGSEISIKNPADAIRQGIALAPEDRKRVGLFLEHPLRFNTSLTYLNRLSKLWLVNKLKENEVSSKYLKLLRVKAFNFEVNANTLSGGNQQKVVLAKWLMTEPDVLILDEPTRGIDVGAKSEIYQLIEKIAKTGKGVLVISSEMPEVLGICDRILVVHEGRIRGELSQEEATQEKIMSFLA